MAPRLFPCISRNGGLNSSHPIDGLFDEAGNIGIEGAEEVATNNPLKGTAYRRSLAVA